jgi:hypothetical protein
MDTDYIDYGDEGDFEEPQENVVNVYRDRERVGYREGLATSIEGKNKLAKYLERQNYFDPEFRLINAIELYFYEVQSYERTLTRSDLQKIIELFHSLPNKLYKNPIMLVLGYVLIQNIERSGLKVIHNLIQKTGQADISDSDVIRYFRLLRSNPLLRS